MSKRPSSPIVNTPNGYAEVLQLFGDIRKFIRNDGTLSPTWEATKITRILLPRPTEYAFGGSVSRVTVHRRIADQTGEMFGAIYRAGLWSKLGPYGGGFVFRPNRNAFRKISLHAFGIAFDWDPEGFPNGSKAKRDPHLREILRRHGWHLGEDFTGTPDPMHIQFATGA